VNWLLLISTLPGQNGALRISVWRTVKSLGAGSLRDGAYVLPDRPDLAGAFQALERDVAASGGAAYLFRIQGQSDAEDARLCALFDRSEDFAALGRAAHDLSANFAGRSEADVRRSARQLRRDCTALESIDYFGSRGLDVAQRSLDKLDVQIVRTFSPDEPSAVDAAITRLERKKFQHRRWATRRHLWVDRVASAWLIRRFIDDDPTFMWLDDPKGRPKDVLGFDFDDADFTHVNHLTTFEVLVLSFDLDEDHALGRLGAVVQYLDVGGGSPAPEAAGFEAILSGLRDRAANDDALLESASAVLDALYDSFKVAVVA
jgi:hypothetical protein